MAKSRHLARIAVMQTIFATEFRSPADDSEKEKYERAQFFFPDIWKETVPVTEDDAFGKILLKGIYEHFSEIRSTIEEFAPEWPFEKIAGLDRAILQIGVYEIRYTQDVPPVVAIDEAIEIAKEFGGDNAAKFINGVLSAVMGKYETKHTAAS